MVQSFGFLAIIVWFLVFNLNAEALHPHLSSSLCTLVLPASRSMGRGEWPPFSPAVTSVRDSPAFLLCTVELGC